MDPSLQSTEVRVAGTGSLHVAALGSEIPDDVGTALSHNDGWVNLGYASEDGVEFTFGRDTKEVGAWQSYDPVRQVISRLPKEVGATLLQSNQHVFELAFGGGTFTETSGGFYRYDPPEESFVDERMFAAEFIDGDFTYRIVYRRALNQEGITFKWVREDAIMFPIKMKVLAADAGEKPFSIYTDDPNIGELLEAAS